MKLVPVCALLAALMLVASSGYPDDGVPCTGTSVVWAQRYAACVGDTIEIYVNVLDCYGVPLQGKSVAFSSTRGASDQIIGATALTDSKGLAKSKITTSVPTGGGSTCTIIVICQGVTIGPSPAISWSGASAVEVTTWGSIKSLYRHSGGPAR